jgi:hypothetical protein
MRNADCRRSEGAEEGKGVPRGNGPHPPCHAVVGRSLWGERAISVATPSGRYTGVKSDARSVDASTSSNFNSR